MDLCKQMEDLREQLLEQKNVTRRLSRQDQAILQTRKKERQKEAGLTDQYKAINRDRWGKAMRKVETARK